MPTDDAKPHLEELRAGNNGVIGPLFGIIHRQIGEGLYGQALQLLYHFASTTSRGSENEKAVVVQSIAIASQFAYKHSLFHAARALNLGARYSADLPERQEIISLAVSLVDLALFVHDYQSAREAVATISICARPNTALHRQAVALAVKINLAETAGRLGEI